MQGMGCRCRWVCFLVFFSSGIGVEEGKREEKRATNSDNRPSKTYTHGVLGTIAHISGTTFGPLAGSSTLEATLTYV